jgi:hypothetical protein
MRQAAQLGVFVLEGYRLRVRAYSLGEPSVTPWSDAYGRCTSRYHHRRPKRGR